MEQNVIATKVPWWKRFLSYLSEIHIESRTSPYNPHLYVSMKYGRFMLSTDKAIYSFADKYVNFKDVFSQIDLEKTKTVLLLGFGLGSIPFMLEKTFHKKLLYTGIEIDEEIIDLASKYVLPNLKSEIELIRADATAFIRQEKKQYDLIAMDIFESDYIPDRFETIEYLRHLKNLLAENGILLYNRLAYTDEDIRRSNYFFENYFKKVFPEGQKIPVKGNYMLMNKQANGS